MYYLIFDNQIAGTAESVDSLPIDFIALQGPDEDINNLYYDGESIQIKPPRPSPSHFWDNALENWILPIIPENSVPNWDKLILLLDNSPEWGRVYAAAEKTLKANTAFTTLLTTLTNLRKVETLEFALAKLREAMSAISGIGDFTAEEIASINQKLTDCGFDLQLT